MPKRKAVTSPADPSSTHRNVRPRSTKVASRIADNSINKTLQQQRVRTPDEAPQSVPVVELSQVAGMIPAENLQQFATAIQSGRWLFAVWHVADGRLHLERTATNFPTVDLDKSVAMLAENLKELSEPR